MGRFEKLALGIYLEGLAVDNQRHIVWYSDVIAGGVHGIKPDGSVQTLNSERRWTGGVMLNEDGCVLSSGGGGIVWNHPETGQSGWLLNEIDGKPISGVNEMVADGKGGIYFGTCDIEQIAAGRTPRPSAIYRLTVDREIFLIAEGVNFCNGIMLSADGSQLYCNDTFNGCYVFDVKPDATLTNKRLLVRKTDCDGMAIDAEGAIWITGFRSGQITRMNPDGTPLSPVVTPAGAITQVRFGGVDNQDIYINAVPSDAGEKLKNGIPLTERNSFLYRGRSAVAGMPLMPAQFRLLWQRQPNELS